MAGLTKEQRAQREAAQKTQIELVVMVTEPPRVSWRVFYL